MLRCQNVVLVHRCHIFTAIDVKDSTLIILTLVVVQLRCAKMCQIFQGLVPTLEVVSARGTCCNHTQKLNVHLLSAVNVELQLVCLAVTLVEASQTLRDYVERMASFQTLLY